MAHEITATDNVVLHRQGAWHGLGIVVEDAPGPAAALQIAGLDWKVEQWPMYATNGGTNNGTNTERIVVENQVANIRTDTKTVLGIVGTGYSPIQNSELAEFCQLLAEQGDTVKVETAGSIRGGAKVWFLLKGESFTVRSKHDDDIVRPYILVSNGHDGGTALRCTPTTVRVVCSNTLHMVIPSWEPETASQRTRADVAAFVSHHTGDVSKNVEQAKEALGLYGRTRQHTIDLIDKLASRDWNSEQVSRFLVQVYASNVEPIPTNPTTEVEQKSKDKAMAAIGSMLGRFDRESQLMGTSAWVAVNAFTGWQQHDRPIRFRDPARVREQRLSSALFGEDSSRAVSAFAMALTI